MRRGPPRSTQGRSSAASDVYKRQVQQGLAKADKKSGRNASEGVIEPYIHGGRIGSLVEINCETDFVAKTDTFKELVHDIALQIAASNPLFVSKADVPQDNLDKEREILRAQALNERR